MRSYLGWFSIVTFVALITAAFFFFQNNPSESAFPDVSFAATSTTTSAAAKPAASPPRVPPTGYKEYRNTDYGFSVFYPENLPPKEFKDRGYALTVSFQSEAGKEGFQIYVAPINGSKISGERFRLDEPSGVKKNEESRAVDGVQAVAFDGLDSQIGATHEVWFMYPEPGRGVGPFLFEITTYKALDTWLDALLDSWQFLPL